MKKTLDLGLQEYWMDGDKPSKQENMQLLLGDIKRGLMRIERMEAALMHVNQTSQIVDLPTCVNHACEALKRQCARHADVSADGHADITVSLEDIPRSNLDFVKVSQVLTHLLINANQATQSSGRIHISATLHNDGLVISVSDNGCGIANDKLGHIFDPLFTTKKDKEVTGLGLAISKDICQQLGGKLCVESELSKGTTFEMHLPLVSVHFH